MPESRNHIKALGWRVAGRHGCDPADSSAPCRRRRGCAMPACCQPARTSGSSCRGHGEGRESRQALFFTRFPSLLLSLLLCSGPHFLGRATRCEHSHSSSFLIFIHTLQLLNSSAMEGLQLKSGWREGIQLPLPAMEISFWKC